MQGYVKQLIVSLTKGDGMEINMIRKMENIVQFPVNAQRSSFFGALSSIILYREGYTEDTPFYCGKNKRNCVRCGNCKEAFIKKHHLNIYQYLVTITGCAYLWEDKAVGDSYNKQYNPEDFSENALDRLSLSLQAYGYKYESFNKDVDERTIFNRIQQSIENHLPILIKLGGGDVWAVITGYHTEKMLPYLMKMNHNSKLNKEWYEKLRNIVFITDKCKESVSLEESLNHMKKHITTKSREKLEQKVYRAIETEPDEKKLGMWLNKMNGRTIENRWHASECYRNILVPMVGNSECQKLLRKASDLHMNFHDQAWKVWELLGVSPQTGYCLPKNICELLNKSSTRTELRTLYQELFSLDREVSLLLQECLKNF